MNLNTVKLPADLSERKKGIRLNRNVNSTVNSDHFSFRRELPAQVLVEGLHFPVLLKCKIILSECNKTTYQRLIFYPKTGDGNKQAVEFPTVLHSN